MNLRPRRCRPIAVAVAFAVLALGVASARAEKAAPARAEQPMPHYVVWFGFGANYWDAVGKLSPDRLAFSPPFGGTLHRAGYGGEMGVRWRVRTIGNAALYLGPDAVFAVNSAGQRYTGTVAGTGEAVFGRMYANSGRFGASAALVWRERTAMPLRITAGTGLYLLRIKDFLDGIGETETGYHDYSFGGSLGAGFSHRTRWKTASWGFDGAVHWFGYDDIGAAFPNQRAGGPMATLGLVVSWAK
jgi:hypothetical protein